ncbi:hypothetical protein QIG33_27945, partial [Klebsiella pneumoniae]|nr:hypothetical protein [Klebsiella pneumoniae]
FIFCDPLSSNFLAAHHQSLFPYPAPAKSGVGIGLLTNSIDDTRRYRFFCVAHTRLKSIPFNAATNFTVLT